MITKNKLTTHLQSRYGISKEESKKIAFNVIIFSLVAAIALVGVILNLVGVI